MPNEYISAILWREQGILMRW